MNIKVKFILIFLTFSLSLVTVFLNYNKGKIPFALSVCGTTVFLLLLILFIKNNNVLEIFGKKKWL